MLVRDEGERNTGIFASRIFGLIRQRILWHYLGLTDAAERVPYKLSDGAGIGRSR